ncbi:unnamed protein product, partial [Owenia fusiformis]
SIQYRAAQAVLQLKCKPARPALLGDLGWSPIDLTIEKRQIAYFKYLKFDLAHSSLPHKVLTHLINQHSEGNEAPWKYVSNIKSILIKRGLDDVLFRDDCEWYNTYECICRQERTTNFIDDISHYKSLNTYSTFKNHPYQENYLKQDFDFYGSRLKFLARTNNFCLESNYSVWGKSDGKCKLCSLNVHEDLQHRLLLCEHFKEERESFFHTVCKQCPPDLFSDFIKGNLTEKLTFIFGDETFSKWGQDYFRLFDSIVKRFLTQVYKPRDLCL